MKNQLSGNLVLPDRVVYGQLEFDGEYVSHIEELDAERENADWILPGFIDLHFHGLGHWGCKEADSIREIAGFAPTTGVTSLCPTLAPTCWEEQLDFLRDMKALQTQDLPGAKLIGAHLEGPFINPLCKGGMDAQWLQSCSVSKVEQLLEAADGSLKLITISPELPGAVECIRRLTAGGVTVSAGHTLCAPEDFPAMVESGIHHVCHLFDTFEGRRTEGGVTQVSLPDVIMLEETVKVELIPDGFHVPPGLVRLTRQAIGAGRIIIITDAMQGTGLPDREYRMGDGRKFKLVNGEVCRLSDDPGIIVGSCLTMNQAFVNLLGFGFTAVEAAHCLAATAAESLKIDHVTGKLQCGLRADVVQMERHSPKVKACYVGGTRHA